MPGLERSSGKVNGYPIGILTGEFHGQGAYRLFFRVPDTSGLRSQSGEHTENWQKVCEDETKSYRSKDNV